MTGSSSSSSNNSDSHSSSDLEKGALSQQTNRNEKEKEKVVLATRTNSSSLDGAGDEKEDYKDLLGKDKVYLGTDDLTGKVCMFRFYACCFFHCGCHGFQINNIVLY